MLVLLECHSALLFETIRYRRLFIPEHEKAVTTDNLKRSHECVLAASPPGVSGVGAFVDFGVR